MSAPNSYRMEESDLDENWRDCLGNFWHPSKIGVPLCSQCDNLVVNGECPECAREAAIGLTIAQMTGIPVEEKALGNGWNRWAA